MGNDWFHEYFINELKAIGRKPTSNMQHEVVDSLPSSGNEQTIYFVKNDSSSSNNHYDEYVWISTSNAFEKIGSTQIDGSATQPDWNQNDATQPDYIKNRPFYTGDPVETVFVEESTLTFEERDGGLYVGGFESTFLPIVGETYKVSWDGTVHECTCKDFNGLPAIGNLSIPGFGSDSGEPFIIVLEDIRPIIMIATTDTSASHTISISGIAIPVVKIDPKYIRDMYYTADPVETVFVEESVVTFEDSGEGPYFAIFRSTFVPTVGETYKVSWDGSVYESTCLELRTGLAIGNLSIKGEGSDTGEPFLIGIFNAGRMNIVTQNTSSSHTISISGWTTQVVKIDEKYLPDTVATKSDVEAVESIANNAQSTANNAQSTANNAQSTANNAQNTANNAQNTANNAVKYTASQNLTDAQKQQARTNIGAGTSSFSGNYNDLANKPTIVQGDWDVNNDADMAYIKNRTHYDYTKYTEIKFSETYKPTASSLINDTYYYGEKTGGSLDITSGNIYKVDSSNGTKYISTCRTVPIPGKIPSYGGHVLGNAQLGVDAGYLDGTNPHYPITDTGEPWCFISYVHTAKNAIISTISNFKIYSVYVQSAHELKQLDEKYIPSTIAKTSDIPTDDHINELINTALSKIGIAEEGAY